MRSCNRARSYWVGLVQYFWLKFKTRLFLRGNVSHGSNFHLGIGSFVSSPYELNLGDNVYIGKYCSIQCSGRIGNGVLIANNVGVVGRMDHDYKQVGVAVRMARSVNDCNDLASDARNSISIGDDVWIGFGAVLLTGIEVGNGAIIAAGSVVFESIPSYCIVRGNPARIVGRRFDEEQIEVHERLIKGVK